MLFYIDIFREKVFDGMPDSLFEHSGIWSDTLSTFFYLLNEVFGEFFGYEANSEWPHVRDYYFAYN